MERDVFVFGSWSPGSVEVVFSANFAVTAF
jgi:hypothetical protein